MAETKIRVILGVNILVLGSISFFGTLKSKETVTTDTVQQLSSSEYFEPKFYIDTLNYLNHSQIAAAPSCYGYSLSKGRKLFPYKRFPKCSSLLRKPPKGNIQLDYQNEYLEMSCKGKYLMGPRQNKTMSSPISEEWQPLAYKEPQRLEPQTEFALGACGEEFNIMQTFPRFKEEAYNRATGIAESLELKKEKPLHILMLGLDSFSRHHFYRKLIETTSYLREISLESNWEVSDFTLHNIQGADTSENLSFFLGEYFQENSLGGEPIWNLLRSKGFVTMMGFDSCSYKIYKTLGENPQTDHLVNSFYCALSRATGLSQHKTETAQKCVGDQMAHWYLMNYISHFSKIYKGANQWIYAHFDTAHEITGQQGQALDDDLVEFLKNYFKVHSEDANVVVYLVADHGMRFGNFGTDLEAIQEHRLPAFFLLTPKSILNSALAHNSHKLTTKGDLRRSIFFLVKWQTGLDTPSASQYYDLFSERIPDNRTCKDAHILGWFCCTNVMHPISPKFTYLGDRIVRSTGRCVTSLRL